MARAGVMKVLETCSGPMAVEEIYRRVLDQPFSATLASVYRVLKTLHKAGLVERHLLPAPVGSGRVVRAAYSMPEAALDEASELRIVCLACRRTQPLINGELLGQIRQFLGPVDATDWSRMRLEVEQCSECRVAGKSLRAGGQGLLRGSGRGSAH